ncbi:hypothetical protein BDW59DRAFT_162480 [Aspergillus cavernicola]|uniref:Acyl-CoA dehydrogenase n=1 Tax=Aspergillus cavernicola TaxID=176166 RepID=A0ABR4I9E3_9EURO
MPPATATATTGHITKPLPLPNTYTSDPSLRRILEWYLEPPHFSNLEPQLKTLGGEAVSSQITEWSADAERNQPYVKGFNVWGERYGVDRLVTSDGWKRLGGWGARNGVVALGYEDGDAGEGNDGDGEKNAYGRERRLAQYAVNYIYGPSSGLTSCPISMTDGAALILSQEIAKKNLPPTHPFQITLNHILSRGPDFWTSGQWMTERAGGSDVQNTETWATYSPLPVGERRKGGEKEEEEEEEEEEVGNGEYLINGFKFFSSATDANVALLLAKTEPAGKLSTFLAPLRRTITDAETGTTKEISNGVRIHRLKNKLGTKELPTAELELRDMRAHLVGDLDKGIQTIAPLLNITRTHTFIGSVGGWRRAISIAKSFARARMTVGEPLWLIPMHLRLMADFEGRHRAAMELSFFTVAVMNVFENDGVGEPHSRVLEHLPIPGKEATIVFRTLTAMAKAVVSKMAILGVQECQEAMGGVGYMDEPDEPEFNVSRILRNMLVNSIWEGTTNVLASEFVRLLVRGENMVVFSGWVERVLGLISEGEFADILGAAWSGFKSKLASSQALVLADGRRAVFTLAWILSGMLLALDAQRDGDGVTTEIARRWILRGELGVGDTLWRDIVYSRRSEEISEETIRWDCRIAWGEELPAVASGHRSMKL